jgi:hypothetical protein
MIPAGSFDSETLTLLSRVFDEAWIETQLMLGTKPLDPTTIRSALATRIMAAAKDGERDPKRLKLIALRAIDN